VGDTSSGRSFSPTNHHHAGGAEMAEAPTRGVVV